MFPLAINLQTTKALSSTQFCTLTSKLGIKNLRGHFEIELWACDLNDMPYEEYYLDCLEKATSREVIVLLKKHYVSLSYWLEKC